MGLLGVSKMSMTRTWEVSVGEVKLGGMAPDTPKLVLHLPASLFHITHDLYHYDLMTLLKNVCTCHWMGPGKSASNRAPHLLKPALRIGTNPGIFPETTKLVKIRGVGQERMAQFCFAQLCAELESSVQGVVVCYTELAIKVQRCLGIMRCATKKYHSRCWNALCFQSRYHQGRLVKTGCQAAVLPEKYKAKGSAKRPNSP